MVKGYITHLERILTNEGKAKAQYIPYFRTLDGVSIKGKPISLKHLVPTGKIDPCQKEKYERTVKKHEKTFSEKGIDTFFKEFEEHFICYAEMPHLNEATRRRVLPDPFITGHNDKVTRQALWRAKAPYCIYDYDEETGKIEQTKEYVSIEQLLQEKKCAIDIETENWRKEELDQRVLSMTEEELKEFYHELAEQTEDKTHPEHLKHWKRKEYLRKIDELVDSLRKEEINAASYITFRDNDTLLHTFDCIQEVKEIEVRIPGSEEKRKIKLRYAKDTEAIGETLTEIIHEDDPLFVFGTNHLNFDYKKLHVLTKGKFRPGTGLEKPKYNANIVPEFLQRRIIPGRLDVDTFPYSMQCSWTFRNNLDTTFNYQLEKDEKKTLDYDELIIKTQQARKGNKKAAIEILYYAAQDAMKSYLLGDYILDEILAESKQFKAPTYKVCTTSKRTLIDDEMQRRNWKTEGTYRYFTPQDNKAWEDYSLYEAFWNSLFRNKDNKPFKSKKGMFDAHIFFPTLYYETLKPVIEKTAKETIKVIENTDNVKKKIRAMQYVNAELEWVLFNLQKEYYTARSQPHKKEECDENFRKLFKIKKENSLYSYATELIERMKQFKELLEHTEILNHSERFLVLQQNLFSDSAVQALQEKNLAISLGKGKILSDKKRRFIAFIDDKIVSQGIDSEGRRERCAYETHVLQGFLQRALIKDEPRESLEFADECIKQYYDDEITEELLLIKRKQKRDFHKYSDRATMRFVREAARKKLKKGDKNIYPRTKEEMFGQNGSIKRMIQMRFPINASKGFFKRLLEGEATQEDLEEIIKATA